MKAENDLSKLKSRKNPCVSKLKRPVTMRLSEDVVAYFKNMATEAGILMVTGLGWGFQPHNGPGPNPRAAAHSMEGTA